MTDRARQSRRHALTVTYATGALFIAILVALLFRFEAGLDPAIGTAAYKVPGTQERKLIVRRKVIIREEEEAPVASEAAAASSGSVAAAPQTQSAQQSAPQSTPAPAPATAPAPSTSAS